MTKIDLSNEDWLAIEREYCARSLANFVKEGWHVLEPATELKWGWALDAICEHLEAVHYGHILKLLANVPPGCMKALDENTPVLTLCGWKRHADLQAGDYVYGKDGRPKLVLGCTQEVLEDSYSVRFDDGSEIIAGSGHEWEIEREKVDASTNWKRHRYVCKVNTLNLQSQENTKGTYARPDRIPNPEPIWFPPRRFLIEPYILGVWLGDGGSGAGCIYAADEDVHAFKQLGEIRYTTKAGGSRKQDFHRIQVDGLATKLRVMGLLNNKHVPEDYLEASYEQRLSLLQGLMDTDGCATKNGACFFTNKNENLADAVAFLASSIGAKAFKKSRYTYLNGKKYGPHFHVSFTPPKGVRVFRLDRKQNRVRQSENKRTFCRYVKSVTPVGKRVVKCISVEDGIYLAGRDLVPTHNSLMFGVFFPAWEWGPRNSANIRYLGTAHSLNLAVRDSMKCRRLIQSEWFQTRWPLALTSDSNAKIRFENEKTGFREAMAFTSMTGSRGDRVGIDDPLSVDEANSEVELDNVIRTFSEALPTRVNNDRSAFLMIMQRLHERDPSGYVLAKELGYTHLCLPMEFEPERRCITSIGFRDPRTEDGELLFPERFSREQVDDLKKTLGSYAAAGQLQQRPVPREGGMFNRAWFDVVGAAPNDCMYVRGWDLAASEKRKGQQGPAYTAGVKVGYSPSERCYYIAHATRGQLSSGAVEKLIRNTAAQDGKDCEVSLPQDPGQAGKAQIRYLVSKLAGYSVHFSPESGSKEMRAEPAAAQAEAGNIKIVRGAWNDDFLDESEMFPNSTYKDQVDGFTRAINRLFSKVQQQDEGEFAAPIILSAGG